MNYKNESDEDKDKDVRREKDRKTDKETENKKRRKIKAKTSTRKVYQHHTKEDLWALQRVLDSRKGSLSAPSPSGNSIIAQLFTMHCVSTSNMRVCGPLN